MRVAITGASGYVGACIANCFRDHGHEVLALSRRQCAAPWLSYTLGDDPRQLPWGGVDTLVHAAYDFTPRGWSETLEKNVKPGLALLESAQQANVRRLIFISSMSAFEGCQSNYGKAKLMMEKAALQLGAVVIRPGLVWGPESGGVMGTLEKLVAKCPIVPYLCGSEGLLQYMVHEADLAEAVVLTAERAPAMAGTLHNMMHPGPVTLHAILKALARRTNLSRIYLPVHWQLAMAGLKCIEALGINAPFRSDSLVGLVHRNPVVAITDPPVGICYRSFS
jgi:nucleoside-diphosphate-sugar epimerase